MTWDAREALQDGNARRNTALGCRRPSPPAGARAERAKRPRLRLSAAAVSAAIAACRKGRAALALVAAGVVSLLLLRIPLQAALLLCFN